MNRTRSLGPLSFVLLLLLLSAPLGPARGAGGDLIWYFQGVEDVYAIDDIQDVDGDSVPDIMVESYDAGAVGDHLYCLSGASAGVASVIWSTKPAGGVSSGGGYGVECMVVSPDVNSDGHEDVFLGTAWGGRSAYALDGTDGSLYYHFDTYYDSPPSPPVDGWVYSVKPVPDLDGDDIPDMFFACGSYNDGVYNVSIGDGLTLWWKYLGDATYTCATLDDVNGDGRSDGVFGVGDNAPAVWVLGGGGSAAQTIWSHTMSGTVHAVARIADVSGDGVNDVLAGIWDATGSVFCFDGTNGDTLWTAHVGSYAYVMYLVALDDVDGDGYEDVAVASWDNKAVVYSGIDGSLVWSSSTGTLNGGDVWKVGRVEDVTGDGINDVVAGSFDYRVYLFDGATGDTVWTYNTGHRLYFVDGVTDVSGNGVPDVVAGTQMLTAGPPGGRAYLIEGGEPISTGVAEAPIVVRAEPEANRVRVGIRGAGDYASVHVERVVDDPSAAEAFKRDLIEAHTKGAMSAADAIAARALTPGPTWVRLTERAIPLVNGAAEFVDATASAGVAYAYRFVLVSAGGDESLSPTASVLLPGLAPERGAPIVRARPNPVNPSTVVEFTLAEPGAARLTVYAVNGRAVADLYDEPRASGTVRVEWDGRDRTGAPAPSGVYFLRLETPSSVATGKVTVVR